MKKINLLVLVTILTVFTMQAQDLELGIKGGLNIPTGNAIGLDKNSNINVVRDNSSGYHAGIFAKFKLAMFAINPEVLYSFQSTEFIDKDLGFSVTQDIKYVTVPIIGRFYLPFGLNFQAGPQFGITLDADQTIDISGIEDKEDIKDNIKGADLGLNLGIGFDLPLGLDIHARYVIGLSEVNDASSGLEAAKNSMFQISLAYSIKK